MKTENGKGVRKREPFWYVLTFRGEYDLLGRANMRLGGWRANKAEVTGHLRVTRLTASESPKDREIS